MGGAGTLASLGLRVTSYGIPQPATRNSGPKGRRRVAPKMFPQLAAFSGNFWVQFYSHQILPALSPQEADEWRAAVARAEAEGTLFFAMPHHCAVGTKP